MKKRFIAFFISFFAMLGNVASALLSSGANYHGSEIEHLHEKLMERDRGNSAVLLLPKPAQSNERFLFLAAHGSHVSHASHSSHVSHVSGVSHKSGSSCQVYTPIPAPLSSEEIPGFKDTNIAAQKDFPLILYLPTSSAIHSSIRYIIDDKPLHGTAEIASYGKLIYMPNPGYEGADSFSMYATDDITSTEPVFFTIQIKSKG
jgi:hypothetical protein